MKLNGFVGKGSGKLGSSVFAISGGEQIVREYNPVVSNPNTEAQVAQRAKLKLLSQLAASMAGQIAIAKQGLVSARNRFVSINYPFTTFEGAGASIPLEVIQLTASSKSMPTIENITASQGAILAQLDSAAPENVKAVVYNVYKVEDTEKLAFVTSAVQTTAGAGRLFAKSFPVEAGSYLVLAYATIDVPGSSKTKYGDYQANVDDEAADLSINDILKMSDGSLSVTQGCLVTLA